MPFGIINYKKFNPFVRPTKEEQQLNAELIKINMDSNRGFVILDFPRNLEQAKILEIEAKL